ncbi:hypothetical protein HPB47_025703 [Ixodes persulcatus]|uniref:Uncharacterized protein n=1 Tax=Ixodes persulcatus TaxID=34615 RepID=A0AC60Q2F2_IXOPE|nr:hypothetical protein HPB47_025703 [Ixodes persulcatus]
MAAALLPSAGGAAMAKSLVSRILGVYKIAKVRPSTRSALVRPLCVSVTSRGVGKYTGIQEIILTKDKAQDLICRLLPEERQILMDELSLHVGATGTTAGLGNAISDAAGIGSAWYVEKLAVKIGVQAPGLTPAQLEMAATRWSANIGRAVGVFVGCILGMFPLLFLSSKEDVRQRHEKPS